MSNHKDLPPSSQKWAGDVDAMMKELVELREVVRRLTENAGIDFANPKRGINTGNTPSVKSPVGQKLSSLADVSTYNVTDGYVLTWDQKEQRWIPKAKAGGGGPSLPADTWSVPETMKNILTDPSFENGTGGWTFFQDDNNSYVRVDYTIVPGAGRTGGNAMRIDFYYDNDNFASSWVKGTLRGLAPYGRVFSIWAKTSTPNLTTAAAIVATGGGFATVNTKVLVPDVWTELRASGSGGAPGTDVWISVEPVPANSPAVSLYVDDAFIGDSFLGSAGVPFNGSYPDDANYSYSWEGAENASMSIRTERRRIQTPSTFSAGGAVQIIGERWVPGETVLLGLDGNFLAKVIAEPDGTFDTVMAIPTYVPEDWQHYISAENDPYTAYTSVEVTLV